MLLLECILVNFCQHSENRRSKLWELCNWKFCSMMHFWRARAIFHNGQCKFSVSVDTRKIRDPNFFWGGEAAIGSYDLERWTKHDMSNYIDWWKGLSICTSCTSPISLQAQSAWKNSPCDPMQWTSGDCWFSNSHFSQSIPFFRQFRLAIFGK